MRKRSKDLVKSTFVISFGTILPAISNVIALPIITAQLTKAEYGIYDLLLTLIVLLLPIVTLQIHIGAFRFLIDCQNDTAKQKEIITTICCFLVFSSLCISAILFFVLHNISLLFRTLVILYFFEDIWVIAIQQIVRGLSKIRLYSLSSVIQSLFNLVLIILTVEVTRKGLVGVLISFITASFISLFILFFKGEILSKIDPKMVSFQKMREMLEYSVPMIPQGLANWVLSVSDRFVLTCMIGIEITALYAAANKIPQIIGVVQGAFSYAWQENASVALNDKDVKQYYSDIFYQVFCILSGVMSLLIASSPLLFHILIRGDYKEAYPQMTVLFMGFFFSSLAMVLGGIYIAHKKTKSIGLSSIVAALVNLMLDLLLIRRIGIWAASLSTLFSYFLLVIYRLIDIRNFQPISYPLKRMILYVILLFVMCGLCWIDSPLTNVLNCIIGVIFSCFINRKILQNTIRTVKERFSHI